MIDTVLKGIVAALVLKQVYYPSKELVSNLHLIVIQLYLKIQLFLPISVSFMQYKAIPVRY